MDMHGLKVAKRIFRGVAAMSGGGGHRDGCGDCGHFHWPTLRPPGIPCFKDGSYIRTSRGETLVEELQVGDRVATPDGYASVNWIGWRRFSIPAYTTPEAALPVRISQNALADGVPSRDLYVSQEHAIFLDGLLIPARALVNERTITLCRAFAEVTYYHVQLEAHSILFADGAPAESFLESGDNHLFFSAGSHGAPLHPNFAGHIGRLVPNHPEGLRRLSGYIARGANLIRRAAAWAGAKSVAELARNLNERAIKHHLGAVAIRSSDGPAVMAVRRRLELRADELESTKFGAVVRLCA